MEFGFGFCSVRFLGKTWVRVQFVLAGFEFFLISSTAWSAVKRW